MLDKTIDFYLVDWLNTAYRSWNMAANDNYLWESQYAVLYGGAAKQRITRPDEDRNDKLLQKPQDTRTIPDWKEAVKGAYTSKPIVDFLRVKNEV